MDLAGLSGLKILLNRNDSKKVSSDTEIPLYWEKRTISNLLFNIFFDEKKKKNGHSA